MRPRRMPERLLKTSDVTEEEDLSSYRFGFGGVPQTNKKIKKKKKRRKNKEKKKQ